MGCFRQSKRHVALFLEQVLNQPCSPGKQGPDKAWLWTFVDVEGVEPTSNASQRALRHAIIWRKRSFGTPSESGSRFVEPLLTVVETCRQRSQNVFAFVTTAVEAHFRHHATPSPAGV